MIARAAAAGAVVVALLLVAGCGGGDGAPSSAPERFLDEFVAADGRVVRHDQGGDTVSEGQAYAMLVAVDRGDEATFDRVWSWTREHLQRPDGLLAWQWRDGRVTDQQPAADADLDAAVALRRAAERFDRPALRRESDRIARAALRSETVDTPDGPLVVAGPWATRERIVNPSYLDPGAYARLGGRWAKAATAARASITRLLDAAPLPPDWATAPGTAAPAPGGGDPPRYGYEAVRLPLRLAAACDDDEARRLAARMWEPLRRAPERLPRALDGTPEGGASTPGMVAAAAAAWAAGDEDAAKRLLDRADETERNRPTYYGSALLALARGAWTPDC